MAGKLHLDLAAEREANDIAAQFMDSSDVVGDMSRAYGTDLSSVRIHTDEDAARKTAESGVDAFSTGKDIFFGRGAFNQNDPASRGLLAHELTHSLQQGVGGGEARQSAPMGEAQGGIIDWFKGLFGRRNRQQPQQQPQPQQQWAPGHSQIISAQKDESPEAQRYMQAMRAATMGAGEVQDRIPAARPGQAGSEGVDSLKQTIAAAVPQANAAYAGDPKNTSSALQALGIRNSATDASKANKTLRGSTFANLNADYAQYFANLEQGGMNLDFALTDSTKGTLHQFGSPGAYSTGGKIDQMNSDMLEMFGQYATSDAGIEYFRNASEALDGADVFGGNQAEVLNFLLRDAINTSATYMGVQGRQSEGGYQSENAAKAAMETTRTLLALPTMSSYSEAQLSQLPETLRPLIAQYKSLVAQIQSKLGGGGAA